MAADRSHRAARHSAMGRAHLPHGPDQCNAQPGQVIFIHNPVSGLLRLPLALVGQPPCIRCPPPKITASVAAKSLLTDFRRQLNRALSGECQVALLPPAMASQRQRLQTLFEELNRDGSGSLNRGGTPSQTPGAAAGDRWPRRSPYCLDLPSWSALRCTERPVVFSAMPATSRYNAISPIERMPDWIRRPLGAASATERVQGVIREQRLHTICEEGRCPNRGECYAAGTATFLLGGPICTRSCAFCQVDKGRAPVPLDGGEAERVAEAVQALNLRYVVLTAVARDDLADHGASLFTATITAIRRRDGQVLIEVLTPDFWGGHADPDQGRRAQRQRLAAVLAAAPVCFNHNLETVERLQGEVRRGATYGRSLELLTMARELAPGIPTKSGLMLGLGETVAEVVATLEHLRAAGCQRLTLGQYLRPSLAHIPVARYWRPEEFEQLGAIAREMGFAQVRSGPLVRSSYHAAVEEAQRPG